jgi:hypothetical protein
MTDEPPLQGLHAQPNRHPDRGSACDSCVERYVIVPPDEPDDSKSEAELMYLTAED